MRKWIESLLTFFSRDVGEKSVDTKRRDAFLINGHIVQTTKSDRGNRLI